MDEQWKTHNIDVCLQAEGFDADVVAILMECSDIAGYANRFSLYT